MKGNNFLHIHTRKDICVYKYTRRKEARTMYRDRLQNTRPHANSLFLRRFLAGTFSRFRRYEISQERQAFTR